MKNTLQLNALPFAALVALAIGFMLVLQALVETRLLAPLEDDAARLTDAIGQQHSQTTATVPQQPTALVQLEAIASRLPTQDTTQTRIERLHQIATRHAVVLRKVSYQHNALDNDKGQAPTAHSDRHAIQADIAGAYPDLRQFLRAILAQDDALAIESLEFSRPSDNKGVRAQVRMTLYLQRVPS